MPLKDIIAFGMAYREQKLKDGWQETEHGLLPMSEIKKAKLVWNGEAQKWLIPYYTSVSDGSDGYKAGTKTIKIPFEYLKWKEERDEIKPYDPDVEIEKIRKQQVDEHTDEIDVTKLTF